MYHEHITTGVLSGFLLYTLQVAMAFAFLSSLYGDFMQVTRDNRRCTRTQREREWGKGE